VILSKIHVFLSGYQHISTEFVFSILILLALQKSDAEQKTSNSEFECSPKSIGQSGYAEDILCVFLLASFV